MASIWEGLPHGWTWHSNESRFKWSQRFVWVPKRSEQSGQRIWLTKAWYGYRLIEGPAGEEPVKLERWLTEEEYVWFQLTS